MLGSLDSATDIPGPLAGALCGDGARGFLARLRGEPGLVAFDADGTLWEGDIGEEVFRALISEDRLVDPPPDPWAQYTRLVKRAPAEGFAFTGRVMRGLSEADLREVSNRVFRRAIERRVFPEMRWLVRELRGRGWEIYVVSASNRWSVETAVESLDLPPARVIALDVGVAAGKLTGEVREPIPALAGKPALLQAVAGRAPDLAFGNSVLDLPLLLSAALPIAVGSVSDAPRNRFLVQAARREWARLEIPVTA